MTLKELKKKWRDDAKKWAKKDRDELTDNYIVLLLKIKGKPTKEIIELKRLQLKGIRKNKQLKNQKQNGNKSNDRD